jgi:hypothetical protein
VRARMDQERPALINTPTSINFRDSLSFEPALILRCVCNFATEGWCISALSVAEIR